MNSGTEKISDERLAEMLARCQEAINIDIGHWKYRDDAVRVSDIYSIITELQSLRSPQVAGQDGEAVEKAAWHAVQGICEWDDRTSPDGYEEYMILKPDELHRVLVEFAALLVALRALNAGGGE